MVPKKDKAAWKDTLKEVRIDRPTASKGATKPLTNCDNDTHSRLSSPALILGGQFIKVTATTRRTAEMLAVTVQLVTRRESPPIFFKQTRQLVYIAWGDGNKL